MKSIKTLVFGCVVTGLSVIAWTDSANAQTTDPFGAAPASAVPVAEGGGSDPFAASPFGSPTTTKPTPNQARRAPVRRPTRNGQMPNQLVVPGKSPAEARIHASLEEETSQSFIETPLAEAIQAISQTHHIPMVIDRRALEELGLSTDTPVTLDLRNVSLRSFLRLMLRDMDLTYLIKDEVLQITTLMSAEQNLVIEMYTLPPKFASKADALMDVIVNTVSPKSWDTIGGNSTMSSFDHILVVSTTTDVHARLQDFLQRMIAKYGD